MQVTLGQIILVSSRRDGLREERGCICSFPSPIVAVLASMARRRAETQVGYKVESLCGRTLGFIDG